MLTTGSSTCDSDLRAFNSRESDLAFDVKQGNEAEQTRRSTCGYWLQAVAASSVVT